VLLTVKAFALDAALDDMTPAVGPDTMILPVLNGMKHVDTLAARFGEATPATLTRLVRLFCRDGAAPQCDQAEVAISPANSDKPPRLTGV
jgi:ketopantoate reductase